MAAEMGPPAPTMRAVAHRMRLQDPRVWRLLPRGRADISVLLAAELQVCQTTAVAKHHRLHKRTPRTRVKVHLARTLAFDFEPRVKAWRRAAQGWNWTREQQADLLGELPGPFEPIARDLGSAIAGVWALSEDIFKNACVIDWTRGHPTRELASRLRAISLGRTRNQR